METQPHPYPGIPEIPLPHPLLLPSYTKELSPRVLSALNSCRCRESLGAGLTVIPGAGVHLGPALCSSWSSHTACSALCPVSYGLPSEAGFTLCRLASPGTWSLSGTCAQGAQVSLTLETLSLWELPPTAFLEREPSDPGLHWPQHFKQMVLQ